ncbi:chromosome segregation protein SMC [Halomonas campisalis]|uniref:Chromosome segregation protein SMC n=1 Tax=Billgrantia campisalis TaxID=74661 RepID=A0ABS9PC46_9GAMM|nr:AAA family ATPase [Halomonas campisalis]MCG6659348.1 chromosome segregation protein SMC [Halomonas campisalis]MDR5863950.1 SbcC/MukB-like Walker B domain-containing protein [Halomonas campisalis]
MKILALRLANLASLPGPLELDFTAAPLADAGLFAITGPTGAGKSTLLDALCLALYGSTPRLRQAPSRDSQIDDTPDSTLTTSDARTLLRRGTASGYAEVDFLGRDGRRYRARWAVRRAREKATGRLQAAEQSLRDLDADRLLTAQKREFERLLPERLGLTFDQFTRAVLLAQSEFAAFLQADDNARSDLLERLTGTGEYSRISVAAYRRANAARKAVDALQARLADDLPAKPEARAELESRAEATRQALTHLQQQEEALKTQQGWHETDQRLGSAYRDGLAQQQAAEHEWQALADRRADRDWRRLIAPRRHAFTRRTTLPDEIAALEASHAETRAALEAARTEQRASAEALEQAEQALTHANRERRQAEPSLREARELAQRLATLEKQLADTTRQHRQQHEQADTLAEAHRQAREAQQARERQRDDWQATLKRLVGTHPRLDDARQAAQRDHDHAARRHLALGELASRWQEQVRAATTRQRLATQVAQEQARRERLLAEGQTARQRLNDAQARLEIVTEQIERSRAVRSESVVRLREALREGEPCPVCGGLDHPWRHRPPTTPEAAQLAAQEAEERRQLSDARQARDAAQERRDTLLGEYRAVEAALEQRRQDLAQAERHRDATQAALAEHPLHGELVSVGEAERDDWLEAQREASDAQRKQARQTLDELARAEAELAPLEEALRQGELVLTRLEAERTAADTQLAELEQQLPPLRAQRDELARRLAARLGEHASPDAWQQHLDTRQEQAQLAKDSAQERRHAAEQAQQRLAQQAAHEAQRLEALAEELKRLDAELSAWRRAHPDLDDTTLARLLEQSEEQARQQEQRIEAAEQARQRATATLAERRRALLAHRREQAPEADDESLLSEAMDRELAERREALAKEQQALAARREEAQRARDAALYALNDDDRRRERQREGQAELEAAQAEHRRWGRISELIGSADGKVFRRIAQAYNLEQLLEHANAHLAGLSRRYRLVRGGSPLGLLVVDTDMGDERRSVHSLSGGETFLVSLALALGLASMASGELTIESLFIDEGFGSLDPQSLALAMEALDGLQALGRRVGVISHVQEMHERIPVQIQVEPLGNGTSRATLVSV